MELKTKKARPFELSDQALAKLSQLSESEKGNISEFTLQEEAAQASNMALNLMNLTLMKTLYWILKMASKCS